MSNDTADVEELPYGNRPGEVKGPDPEQHPNQPEQPAEGDQPPKQ